MGSYTGLRFKGIVKEEYAPLIQEMVEGWWHWDDLVLDFPNHPFLEAYSEIKDSSLVPYGHLEFMPDSWEEDLPGTHRNGFEYAFDKGSRLWSFQCSTKQDQVIEAFLRIVASTILEESVHIETYFEYDTHSKLYDYAEGKIILRQGQGIQYKD